MPTRATGALGFVERCVTAALLAATIGALLLAARNGLVPAQQPWSFALVLWVCHLLLFLALSLPLALGLTALGRWPRLAWLPRVMLAAGVLALLAAAALWNDATLQGLGELGGPARHRWLVPAALMLAVLGMLAAAGLPSPRQLPVRLLALAALAATLAALYPEAETARAEPEPPPAPRLSTPPLLVVGVDGADWRLIERLFARDELPHLATLRRRGAWGPLRTFRPTLSPAIWTSIATGRRPADHGIRGFTRQRLAGVDDTLPRLKPIDGLGWQGLEQALRWGGLIYESPIVSGMRLEPAFWTLATRHGSPVSVINWWGTWPAEPVLGFVVSERALHPGQDEALTYPESLQREIALLTLSRQDVTLEQLRVFMEITPEQHLAMRERARASAGRDIEKELPVFLGQFETTRRAALHLIARGRARFGRPTDLLTLFRIVDQTCHSSLRFSELVEDRLGAPAERVRRFGRVVSAAYRAMDAALGELLAAMGEANVVVLSDHGFVLEGGPRRRAYNHRSAPDGIFLAAGPAFRPGRVEGLDAYDVLPLLAYLKELPVARRLEGSLDERLIAPDYLSAHPVRRIARYDAQRTTARAHGAREVDREMLERLRALGYLE